MQRLCRQSSSRVIGAPCVFSSRHDCRRTSVLCGRLPLPASVLNSYAFAYTHGSRSVSSSTSSKHYDLRSFINYYGDQIYDQVSDRAHGKHVYEVDGTSNFDGGAWRRPIKDITNNAVFRGTRYEYLIQDRLRSEYALRLSRIGGRGDAGVDLIGTWRVPVPISKPDGQNTNGSRLRVVVQAKRMIEGKRPMPSQMRELEGALNACFPLDGSKAANATNTTALSWQRHLSEVEDAQMYQSVALQTLGVLVTTQPLTPGVQKAMVLSRRALMYICLKELPINLPEITNENEWDVYASTRLVVPETRIQQMIWNHAASNAGLEGFSVGLKATEEAGGHTEAILQWHGKPVSGIEAG